MSEDSLWEDGHSIFAPSYSATWLNCAGSLHPSLYADDSAGYDAAVGTVFHKVMHEWLTVDRPDSWLGNVEIVAKRYGPVDEPPFEVEIDEDMFTFGEDCIAYLDKWPGDRWFETRVDISDLTPINNQGGTADVIICNTGTLDIIDWKYGKGVQVFAEKNTQLLLYAWGAFQKFDYLYDFKTIRIHVAQPRFYHFEYWEISREELIEWAAWAKERAYSAWFDRDRSPSPKACQWCRVRTNCTAMEAAREALVDMTFEVLDEPITVEKMASTKAGVAVADGMDHTPSIPSAAQLDTLELSRIRKWRRVMEAWFADIDAELLRRLDNGEKCEDWKIVEGRSRRKWRDHDETAEKLSLLLSEDQIFPRTIVSPAKAEKLLRTVGVKAKLNKTYVATMTIRPPGRPTLVPAGDARVELPNIVDPFDDVEDDDI